MIDLEYIRKLIQQAKLEEGLINFRNSLAVNKLKIRKQAFADIENQLILLLSRYNSLNKENMMGLIGYDTYTVGKNNISYSFLRLINEFDSIIGTKDASLPKERPEYNYNKESLQKVKIAISKFFKTEPLKVYKLDLYEAMADFYISKIIKPLLLDQIKKAIKRNLDNKKGVYSIKSELKSDINSSLNQVSKRTQANKKIRIIVANWMSNAGSIIINEMDDIYHEHGLDFNDFSLSHHLQFTKYYFEYNLPLDTQLNDFMSRTIQDSIHLSSKPKWYHFSAFIPSALLLLGGPAVWFSIGILALPLSAFGGIKIMEFWRKADADSNKFLKIIKDRIKKNELKEIKDKIRNEISKNVTLYSFLKQSIDLWFEKSFIEQVERIDILLDDEN